MTQRGKMGGVKEVPMRPVTPPAPDSLSVPPQKIFTNLRSIGRGAAADIKSRIRSVAELQRSPGATQYRGGEWYEILIQEIEEDARTCYHDDEHPSDDHTWGFLFSSHRTIQRRMRRYLKPSKIGFGLKSCGSNCTSYTLHSARRQSSASSWI